MHYALKELGPPAHFYECPRWRQGCWWLSDMRGRRVYSLSTDGEARIEVELDDRPGGLGWTPEGDLLVVSMEQKRLLRISPAGGARKVLELAGLFGDTEGFLNDLAVGPTGHVYVGFDADLERYGPDAERGMIVQIPPQGAARIAAGNLALPNGLVFTPDGATLVVAETLKPRLTSFSVAADGSLGARRLWGALDPRQDARAHREPPLGDRAATLDGCAMDAEGCVWAADIACACLRIAPGGAVVDAVFLPDGLRAFACALGGADGRTLLLCGADENFADRTSRRASRLFTAQVGVPAA